MVQLVSYLAPNRHFTMLIYGIMLKGFGLAELWPQAVALRLRKRLD